MITIRKSHLEELPEIMKTYEYARSFMAAHGNPNQWGATKWPPEDLIRADIAAGKSYVCIENDEIVGVFYYDQGDDIEPAYRTIEEGSWMDDSPYGVIHRIAGNGKVKGVAHAAIRWACQQCSHFRIDTHPANLVMQNLLKKEGLIYRGVIHVLEDNDPRIAFERV